MKKTNKFVFLCIVLLGVGFFTCPERVVRSMTEMMEKCAVSLIPGLFPFMVLGNMLVECGGADVLKKIFSWPAKKLFGLNGACALPVITGFVSGLPVGAAVTAELVKKGEISAEEGARVLCFCNNPGPAFILSALVSMLGCGTTEGVLLWVSVSLSALAAGICFGRGKLKNEGKKGKETEAYTGPGECLVNSVKKSVMSILNVCGFVLFFGVVNDLVTMWNFGRFSGCLTTGIMEVTNGCLKLSGLNLTPKTELSFASAFLGWSGLCAHAQVAAAVKGSGISLNKYIRAKAFQTIVSPVITLLLCKIVPFSLQTAKVTGTDPEFIVVSWSFVAIITVFGAVLLIISAFSVNRISAERSVKPHHSR